MHYLAKYIYIYILWGRNKSKPASNLSALGPKDPHNFVFCLQLRLIRYEWGTSFFNVRASLKNYSHCLQRTKLCRSFGPKANKLLVGLDSFLPHVL